MEYLFKLKIDNNSDFMYLNNLINEISMDYHIHLIKNRQTYGMRMLINGSADVVEDFINKLNELSSLQLEYL